MKDETLLKVSLIIAAIGLIFLFLLSGSIQPNVMAVAQLNGDILDQKVQVTGTSSSIRTSSAGHTFFTLTDDTGKISVVAFAGSKLQPPNGTCVVTVKGRLQEYNGKLEIVAEAISTS
ncbi:MAG: exodeoxyribonuclease VII large subunit [Candidatus Aenigmatarchaeota archaeon]